jgi:hypothetical protein
MAAPWCANTLRRAERCSRWSLLGSYFPAYLQGVSALHAAQGGGHGPANVQQPGLIVQTGGHMGNFAGRAYLPASLPQGTSPDDLQ